MSISIAAGPALAAQAYAITSNESVARDPDTGKRVLDPDEWRANNSRRLKAINHVRMTGMVDNDLAAQHLPEYRFS